MWKLIIKITVLVAPYALYFAIPFFVILGTNELYLDLDRIILKVTEGNRYLIGLGFDETPYRYLKFKTLASLPKQDIVAIGSSRVLTFRDKMFSQSSFYNAGYTVDTIDDFSTFLSLVPNDKVPGTIIIGIDQWMFNTRYTQDTRKLHQNSYINLNVFDFNTLVSAAPKIYKNIYNGTLSIATMLDSYKSELAPDISEFKCKKIGFNAHINSTGFLNDGSIYYGKQIADLISGCKTANDYNFEDTFNRIRTGSARFQYGSEVDTASIHQLENFLDICKKKNICVVAFLPPLADKVYTEMISSGKYKYISLLPKKLGSIFNRYGFEFYDFTTIASTGSTDNEALDGFHGSEAVYMNILIKMLDAGSILNKNCNISELKMRLENKLNRYTIYKPD
ncbi:MAG TPA: hypothetical protein VGJ93_09660 [Desulfuromonadaceae bacterium]|jgi:hypothetical protein